MHSSSRYLSIITFGGASRAYASPAFSRRVPAARRNATSRVSGGGWRIGVTGRSTAGWGFFLAAVSLLLFLVLAGLAYIHQVTRSAVGGYDISSLERRVNELKEEEQRLQLHAAELQSLKNIEKAVEKLNFVPTEQIVFTSPIVGGSVARSVGGHGASSF